MASPSPKVIIFGPTGAVGSAAARTAASLGAHVTLAMRDTSKAISGIPDTSSSDRYVRIQADLTQPATVSAAVKQSNATHAFIYLIHQSQDHMRSTIQALKDSGITLIVFLSSFTVTGTGSGALSAIPPSNVIDYLHARVELQLEEIFTRSHFVALRPGSFASNEFQYAPAFSSNSEVKITYPKSRVDCIAPADIGRVGGTILARGMPQDGNSAIYLYGPEFLKAQEVVATIARVLGKDPKVSECDEQEARKVMSERGYPPPLVEYFVGQTHKAEWAGDGEGEIFGRKVSEKDRGNVEKYGGGGKATTFEQFVKENREAFGVRA